jgi:hypothetical protein
MHQVRVGNCLELWAVKYSAFFGEIPREIAVFCFLSVAL